MTTVREMIKEKGDQIWHVAPDATVYQTMELMAEKNVGALLVMEQGRMVGIVSERDYARKIVLRGKRSQQTPVSEIMVTKVYYVTPDMRVEDCMAIMTNRHIRHLPVLENEKVCGIVTIGDVVKHIISDQKFTIEQLEQYIVGPMYPGS